MNKTLFFALVIIMTYQGAVAQSWADLFNEKNELLSETDFKIIKEQYKSVIKNSSPTIAHPIIKNINIIDDGEPLVDIYMMHNNRISMLPNPPENKPFYGAAYNSGLPNASKIRKSVYEKLEKMLLYLDEYSELFGYEPGEISIKVFEGLRDLETQEKLFQSKLKEIKQTHAHYSEAEAETETSKWVSPVKNNVPAHSTGAAIDIRLWSEKLDDFLDLGKFGVLWGENKEAQTFSENLTSAQKLHRLLLLMAAAKAGLVNYAYEYWHFSYGDRYAAYWQENDPNKRIAYYGACALINI